MKFIRLKEQLEQTKQKTTIVNVFYKNNYKYTISIVENKNIIKVTKEDTKSEYFETEYFKII